MSELQSAPIPRALDARYETVGELREAPNEHRFIARRRADGADVMITVVSAERGGENNALAHFASDVQRLTNLRHRRVPRVIEGLWVGRDSFGMVSERVHGSTLHEMLSAGERLPNPRIASVLHEVNEVLEWAREHGIVHRGVTPDTLWFQQETHAVRVSLALTAIPLQGLPDERSDAQTIGRLAWAMLTGHTTSDPTGESLRDLRRDLARRVVDETNAMINGQSGGANRDVERFLSVLAMADALREGEIQSAQLQAEMIEERRVERVRLEAEARASAERAEAMEARLRKERAEFSRQIAREEARIASEAQQVAVERSQLEQERLELDRRVAALSEATEGPKSAEVIPVISYVEEELLRGERRFSWIIPVATIGMLVMLIFVGALMARRGAVPRTITIGRSTIVPTLPDSAAGVLPRGGFLNQGTAGNARAVPVRRDTVVKGDTVVRPDTIDSLPPDTLKIPRF